MDATCHKCNAQVARDQTYCGGCGTPLPARRRAPGPALPRPPGPSSPSGLDGDETLLWRGTVSARGLSRPLLAASIATVVLAAWCYAEGALVTSTAGCMALVWTVFAVLALYRKITEFYELTSRRIIHRHGFLFRTTNFLEVIDVDDVTLEQNLLERLLNTGTVVVESSDQSHPVLVISGVHPATEITHRIEQARHHERLRRGVHVELV